MEHRDGHSTRALASLKKSIYSIIDPREIMLGCNQRYLAFLESLDDTSAGQRDLQRLSQPRVSTGSEQTVKGLNFFDPNEQRLLKKVAHTYRYYLTRLGRSAIAAACSITRFSIIPAMAQTV